MTSSCDEFAKELRDVWSLGEGPQVEDALYAFSTRSPSASRTVKVQSWADILTPFHKAGIDDQFIPPLQRVNDSGAPVGMIKEGDVVIYTDFRTDRAKPLAASFLGVPFEGQSGGLTNKATKQGIDVLFVTMTHYDDKFTSSPKLREAFNPAEPLSDTYTEVAGRAGIKQLIVAESEKWRAITWFKDGRRNLGYVPVSRDELLRVEQHPTLPATIKVVQSREVAAHIQAPKMRAKEITDVLLQGISDGVTDLFANFANSDMVAHAMTRLSDFDAVVEAILELDTQLARLVPAALSTGYTVIITADHGNAEDMKGSNGKANPAHTCNKVPLIVLGLSAGENAAINPEATIGDMAPTMLHLRGMEKPSSWDRHSFLNGTIVGRKDRKIMRLVLDGYGVSDNKDYNAMAVAATKKGSPLHMDNWMNGVNGAISTRAEASGLRCGYPEGESGTTEFGHVLFDAGRTVRSDLVLIDHNLVSGDFVRNAAFKEAFAKVKSTGCTVHVMGIVSDGKVHSSLTHLEGVLRMAKSEGVLTHQLSIHAITDGRDVPGDSSPKYISWLENLLKDTGVGAINSIWGRGWGKDRDNRWLRIEAAYRSLTEGTGGVFVQFPAMSKI